VVLVGVDFVGVECVVGGVGAGAGAGVGAGVGADWVVVGAGVTALVVVVVWCVALWCLGFGSAFFLWVAGLGVVAAAVWVELVCVAVPPPQPATATAAATIIIRVVLMTPFLFSLAASGARLQEVHDLTHAGREKSAPLEFSRGCPVVRDATMPRDPRAAVGIGEPCGSGINAAAGSPLTRTLADARA
jgi:hypothetical protein